MPKKKNRQKLVLMRGLPGSGKTTYAKSLIEEGYKRVGRDDLRLMLDNKQYDESMEEFVQQVELSIIDIALREGYNVVIDDTNGDMKRIEMLLRLFGNMEYSDNIDVKVERIMTPLDECLERDSKRGPAMVGEKVIKDIYKKFFKKEYDALESIKGK